MHKTAFIQLRRLTAVHSLRALRHRDFRLFIAGIGTSQLGSWMQLVTTSWLIYELTGSTLMLGAAAFALQIAFFVVGPFAGVILDRLDVRKVLFVSNSVALAISCILVTLAVTNSAEAWHLIALNLALGISNSFDVPARQSLFIRLVGSRDDLPSAIAMNSAVMNGARVIGPAVGGLVIGTAGIAVGFAANCILRFAVVAALAAMNPPASERSASQSGWRAQFLDGLRYAYGYAPTRNLLLLLALASLTIHSHQSMLPWFVQHKFDGAPQVLGYLMSANGLGALTGLLLVAGTSEVASLFRVAGQSAALAGAALIAFSLSTSLYLALPMMFLVGMGMVLTSSSTNTILQYTVPDDLRSRVLSLYFLSFVGVAPFGALASGYVAERLGASWTFLCMGLLAVAGGGTYLLTYRPEPYREDSTVARGFER